MRSKSVARPRLGSVSLPGWTGPKVSQHLYLSPIPKCICRKLQNVFVSNSNMYLSQIPKCICLIFDIRTMSPAAIAEAKEFAEKENLHGVVRWFDCFFLLLIVGLVIVRDIFSKKSFMLTPFPTGKQRRERSGKRKWWRGLFIHTPFIFFSYSFYFFHIIFIFLSYFFHIP